MAKTTKTAKTETQKAPATENTPILKGAAKIVEPAPATEPEQAITEDKPAEEAPAPEPKPSEEAHFEAKQVAFLKKEETSKPAGSIPINENITEGMNNSVSVKIKTASKDVKLPEYKTADAAGMDLHNNDGPVVLLPNERKLVGTGLFIELPKGYEAQVRPRSGLALEHGVTVLNAPGTVDADYRKEVKVLLVNLSNKRVILKNQERIAQLVVAPVSKVAWNQVDELTETDREGGFGSTGKD